MDGWDYNTSKNAYKYISPHNSSLIIRPLNFCNKSSFLVIVVCSAPGNFEARNVIRDTWASKENLSKFNIQVYFLLGQLLNTADSNISNNSSSINKLYMVIQRCNDLKFLK